MKSWLARIALGSLIVVAYLASTVPVGLFLYAVKSDMGWDVFKTGGYHKYLQCVRSSFPLEDIEGK